VLQVFSFNYENILSDYHGFGFSVEIAIAFADSDLK
jgi:hypothetical protein